MRAGSPGTAEDWQRRQRDPAEPRGSGTVNDRQRRRALARTDIIAGIWSAKRS